LPGFGDILNNDGGKQTAVGRIRLHEQEMIQSFPCIAYMDASEERKLSSHPCGLCAEREKAVLLFKQVSLPYPFYQLIKWVGQ
jgi:hypothetical protein